MSDLSFVVVSPTAVPTISSVTDSQMVTLGSDEDLNYTLDLGTSKVLNIYFLLNSKCTFSYSTCKSTYVPGLSVSSIDHC